MKNPSLNKMMKEMEKKKRKPSSTKDIIIDPMGQWRNPGLPVIVPTPTGEITMQGVPYPVLGIGNNGQQQMMYPGRGYIFPGADYVYEHPLMKAQNGRGISMQKLPKAQKGKFINALLNTPEAWEKSIKEIENQIGDPSKWTIDDYNRLQNKLYEYKNWRENTEEGRRVVDYSNKPNEYVVPLPTHLSKNKETRYIHNPSVGGKTDYAIRRTVTPYKTKKEIKRFTQMPTSGEDVDFNYWYRNASNKKDAMSVPFEGDKHWNIDRGIIDVQFGNNYPNLNQSKTSVEENRNNVLADMYKYYMLQNPNNKNKAWRQAKRFVRKEIDPRINNEYFKDIILNQVSPNMGTLTGFADQNPFKTLKGYNEMFVDDPTTASAYHPGYKPEEWTMDRMEGISRDYLRDYKGLSRKETRRQIRDWKNEYNKPNTDVDTGGIYKKPECPDGYEFNYEVQDCFPKKQMGGEIKWLDRYDDGGSAANPCPPGWVPNEKGECVQDEEARRALAKKSVDIARQKIASGNYYDVPQEIKNTVEGQESAYGCIGGVCSVLTEAGVMSKPNWSNTDFALHAKDYGFPNKGYGLDQLRVLEPGDVLQYYHVGSKNYEKAYPHHAQLFLGINEDGEYEFFDNYHGFEYGEGLKKYTKEQMEDLFNPSNVKNKEEYGRIYKVNPYTPSPSFASPEAQLAFENRQRKLVSETGYDPDYNYGINPEANIDILEIPEGMRRVIDFGNDNEKVNKLIESLYKLNLGDITDKAQVHNSIQNVFGILGQENKWKDPWLGGNIIPGEAGKVVKIPIESTIEKIFSPRGWSIGPGQIKFNQLSPAMRREFNINKPSDLYDWEKLIPLMVARDIENKNWMVNQGEKLGTRISGEPGSFENISTTGNPLDIGRYSPYFWRGYGKKVKTQAGEEFDDEYDLDDFNSKTEYDDARNKYIEENAYKYQKNFDRGSYGRNVQENIRKFLHWDIGNFDRDLPEVVIEAPSRKKLGGTTGWLDNYEDGGLLPKFKPGGFRTTFTTTAPVNPDEVTLIMPGGRKVVTDRKSQFYKLQYEHNNDGKNLTYVSPGVYSVEKEVYGEGPNKLPEVVIKGSRQYKKSLDLARQQMSWEDFRKKENASYPNWYRQSKFYNPEKDLENQRNDYKKLTRRLAYQNMMAENPQQPGEDRIAYQNRLNSIVPNFVENARSQNIGEPFEPSVADKMLQWGKRAYYTGAAGFDLANPFTPIDQSWQNAKRTYAKGDEPSRFTNLTKEEASNVGIFQPFEEVDRGFLNYVLKPTLGGLERATSSDDYNAAVNLNRRYATPTTGEMTFAGLTNPINWIGLGEARALTTGAKNLVTGARNIDRTADVVRTIDKTGEALNLTGDASRIATTNTDNVLANVARTSDNTPIIGSNAQMQHIPFKISFEDLERLQREKGLRSISNLPANQQRYTEVAIVDDVLRNQALDVKASTDEFINKWAIDTPELRDLTKDYQDFLSQSKITTDELANKFSSNLIGWKEYNQGLLDIQAQDANFLNMINQASTRSPYMQTIDKILKETGASPITNTYPYGPIHSHSESSRIVFPYYDDPTFSSLPIEAQQYIRENYGKMGGAKLSNSNTTFTLADAPTSETGINTPIFGVIPGAPGTSDEYFKFQPRLPLPRKNIRFTAAHEGGHSLEDVKNWSRQLQEYDKSPGINYYTGTDKNAIAKMFKDAMVEPKANLTDPKGRTLETWQSGVGELYANLTGVREQLANKLISSGQAKTIDDAIDMIKQNPDDYIDFLITHEKVAQHFKPATTYETKKFLIKNYMPAITGAAGTGLGLDFLLNSSNQNSNNQQKHGGSTPYFKKGGSFKQFKPGGFLTTLTTTKPPSFYENAREKVKDFESEIMHMQVYPGVNKFLSAAQDKGITGYEDGPLDALRHASAASHMSSLIPSWMNFIPGVGAMNLVGTNLAGAIHEFNSPNSLKATASDLYNNFIGSVIGSLPVSKSTKDNLILKALDYGLLSTLEDPVTGIPDYYVNLPGHGRVGVLPEVVVKPKLSRASILRKKDAAAKKAQEQLKQRKMNFGGSIKYKPQAPFGGWLDKYN